MKMEVKLMKCETDEATTQAGLAHSTAEEANNMLGLFEEKVEDVH